MAKQIPACFLISIVTNRRVAEALEYGRCVAPLRWVGWDGGGVEEGKVWGLQGTEAMGRSIVVAWQSWTLFMVQFEVQF
jgi:hypothetical protein